MVEDELAEIKIANKLCEQSNDLKNVKIHEFKKYMNNQAILE